MLDRLTEPLLARIGRSHSKAWSRSLRIGFVVALTTPVIAFAASQAIASGDDASGPSVQYQEAASHASNTLDLAPGGTVTVPFRPRPGDTTMVDGAAPVALPAGQGAAPSVTGPGPKSSAAPAGALSTLRRGVFGFLPYWQLQSTLDYDTLSTVAYFGVNVKADGSLDKSGNGWNGWTSSTLTSVINNAHAHGTRVALTIESFAWDSGGTAAQTALLSTPAAVQAAVQAIVAQVVGRGVDGVNLDFEPIASGQKTNFVTFVRALRTALDAAHPGYELTFCATGRPNTYDLPNLLADGAADAVFIMGYNLRGGTPGVTGSIDPLTSPYISYDLTDAVNAFITKVPASKVILGLPWYGSAWSTATNHAVNAPPASSTTYGKPLEVTYDTFAGLAAMSDSTHLGKFYDTVEQTAWTAYYGTYGGQPTWREGYFDDARALGAKCDAIDAWNLRGVGIWALGYDNRNGDGDLTAEIATKFEVGIASTSYYPLSEPVRIVDTRVPKGLTGKLVASTPGTFQVGGPGGIAGVPAAAVAVTGTVTVTDETNSGFVYVGPFPIIKPPTSTLNFRKGDTTANGVTVALSGTGTLSATFVSSGGSTAQLVFDLTGYFAPDTGGSTYHPMTPPARLLDTRIARGLPGKFLANTPRSFSVAGVGAIDASAKAVTGNLTVVNSSSGGFVSLGPDQVDKPSTSTVNFKKGQVVANNLTVALSLDGKLSATFAAAAGNKTDLVFDVTGYYTADATGVRFVPVTPARLLDTRSGNGLSGKLTASAPRSFPITNRVSVPVAATAITGNLTVVNETSGWAIYAGPTAQAKSATSNFNFVRGDTRANGLTVALSTGGGLSVTYLSSGRNTTDLVMDVTGYFLP
jgi:spore germination protein YaaH